MTTPQSETAKPRRTRPQLSVKTPNPTASFWIAKLLTTACGEALSDYLAKTYGPAIAASVTGVLLAVFLTWQIALRRHVTWVYWGAVTMVAIFGTLAADGLHVLAGVPYVASSIAFAVILAVILTVWWLSERTLSIHSIDTRRREGFYWGTVGATFALGTAVGDLTARVFGWGYLTSGIIFALLFALTGAAFRWWHMNAIAAFWTAYILTRPLGASLADWFALEPVKGGLALGPGQVGLVLLIGIVIVVAWMSRKPRQLAR